jgi:dTDP-glucose 4,6-dehydratase
MSLLVTGGAGFIGSCFVLEWVQSRRGRLVNLDALTYAGHPGNLSAICNHDGSEWDGYTFIHGDICDSSLLTRVLRDENVTGIVHFAAESHVDRSIVDPGAFLDTNVMGTFALLQAAREYWQGLSGAAKENFRFLHVSTDEVYGTLGPSDAAFTESTAYAPNSPYAASKAGSDHLARAYHHTYGMPVMISNCSNNYGPRQFPEKLIPLMLLHALEGKPLPVYGDGRQVRDWLYVEDHCAALRVMLGRGRVGETYNVGGRNEETNLHVVETLCDLLDELRPDPRGSYRRLISFVADRPGHDRRYAINCGKIERELGWTPKENFATGLRKTVEWYLGNAVWVESVTSGSYRNWIRTNYDSRESLQTEAATAAGNPIGVGGLR